MTASLAMQPRLLGRRIGVLEARMADSLAALLEREGAAVMRAPALRERAVDAADQVRAFAEALERDAYAAVVFLTGVGAGALLDELAAQGRLERARAALARTTVVCRGPKPVAALKPREIQVTVTVEEPWTTKECVAAMAALPVAGARVALVHYGERNEELRAAILARGCELDELCLYEWLLPEDLAPIEDLVGALIAGRLDIVAFTSQVQVRHLFEVAERIGRASDVGIALRERTTVAAVGPTCAAALESRGIPPAIVPVKPKMGPFVAAIAQHVHGRPAGEPPAPASPRTSDEIS